MGDFDIHKIFACTIEYSRSESSESGLEMTTQCSYNYNNYNNNNNSNNSNIL